MPLEATKRDISADIRKPLFKRTARAGPAIRYTYICSTRGADLELAMVNFCCKKNGPRTPVIKTLNVRGPSEKP